MPLFLLPSTALFPRFYDELFEDYEPLESSYHETPTTTKQSPMTSPELAHQKTTRWGLHEEMCDMDSRLIASPNLRNMELEEPTVALEEKTHTSDEEQEIKDHSGHPLRDFLRRWVLADDVDMEYMKSMIANQCHFFVEDPKIPKNSLDHL